MIELLPSPMSSRPLLKLLALIGKITQKTFFLPFFLFYPSQILIPGTYTMVNWQERNHQKMLKTKGWEKPKDHIYEG